MVLTIQSPPALRKQVPTGTMPSKCKPVVNAGVNTVMMLEDAGHSIVEAASGPEALNLLTEKRFDLLITDQAMPKMTNVQLAEIVRENYPEMPIFVATGYAELPPNVSLPRLSKPFDQHALARAINACLKCD